MLKLSSNSPPASTRSAVEAAVKAAATPQKQQQQPQGAAVACPTDSHECVKKASRMTIDTNAKINISLAATIVSTLVLGAWYTASTVSDFRQTTTDLSRQIQEVKAQIDGDKADRYTKSLAAEVALRNAIMNPGTSFADPRDPTKAIYVDSGRIGRGTQPGGG